MAVVFAALFAEFVFLGLEELVPHSVLLPFFTDLLRGPGLAGGGKDREEGEDAGADEMGGHGG